MARRLPQDIRALALAGRLAVKLCDAARGRKHGKGVCAWRKRHTQVLPLIFHPHKVISAA